ncbi:MAG: hypothetical protein ACRCW2_09000 [Cellulosilyticaceae bacterium]
MKEYEDVEFIPTEEDTSFSKYKQEKEREERRKSRNFVKMGLKILLIIFALIFLTPFILGGMFLVGGFGVMVSMGSIAVLAGGIAALVVSVFLMSSGWMSMGVFFLFVTMACMSAAGIVLTLGVWIIKKIISVCVAKYRMWRYKDEPVIVEEETE